MTRKILIGVAMGGVWAAFGCGSSGSNGTPGQGQGPGHPSPSNFANSGTVPADPNAPPADPNAPPANPNAPPPDPNAPPPDPNAPPGGGGGGAPSSGSSCTALCAGIDSACADDCAQRCRDLDASGTRCTGVFAALRNCLGGSGLVCTDHQVNISNPQCSGAGAAFDLCTRPPGNPPGTGGDTNGSGGQNNGGGQCRDLCASIDPACSQSCNALCAEFDALPPSCSDAGATAKSCIMNAGLTCNNGAAAPTGNQCGAELSALRSCVQPPMGAGGTGP